MTGVPHSARRAWRTAPEPKGRFGQSAEPRGRGLTATCWPFTSGKTVARRPQPSGIGLDIGLLRILELDTRPRHHRHPSTTGSP